MALFRKMVPARPRPEEDLDPVAGDGFGAGDDPWKGFDMDSLAETVKDRRDPGGEDAEAPAAEHEDGADASGPDRAAQPAVAMAETLGALDEAAVEEDDSGDAAAAAEDDDAPAPIPARSFEDRLATLRQQLSDPPKPADPPKPVPMDGLDASDEGEERAADTAEPAAVPAAVEVPAPAAGRAGRRAGRVKTRLLGFEHSGAADPIESAAKSAGAAAGRFPVGWLVVADGPGRGAFFSLFTGVSQIGRGEDQAVKLDFGDTTISRSGHAVVAYDDEQKKFFLGHGGKVNLVRLNGKPVLSTEELRGGDGIRIGETTLHFVALCGDGFDWSAGAAADDADDTGV